MELDFPEKVLDCAKSALEAYGKEVGKVVFWQFETKTNLKPVDLWKNPKGLLDTMVSIFGPASKSVEMAITRKIISSFDLRINGQTDLPSVIRAARSAALKDELIQHD